MDWKNDLEGGKPTHDNLSRRADPSDHSASDGVFAP
jgi:hypothetical protein